MQALRHGGRTATIGAANAGLRTGGRALGGRRGCGGNRLFGNGFGLDNLRAGGFFSGALCGFFGFANAALFFLAGPAGLLDGAKARVFRVTQLRFGKRAAAGIDFFRRQLVQHDANARTRRGFLAAILRLLANGMLLAYRLRRLRGRSGRARLLDRTGGRCGNGRDRLFVFRAVQAGALACLDHDSLGPAAPHILAHRPLLYPGWLERQRLLASHAEGLVVFVIGHSVPFLAIRPATSDRSCHEFLCSMARISGIAPVTHVIDETGQRHHGPGPGHFHGTSRA